MSYDRAHVLFLPTLSLTEIFTLFICTDPGWMRSGSHQMVRPFLLNDKKPICWQVCMLRDPPLTNTRHISLLCIVLHQRQPRGEGYMVERLMMCGPNQSIPPPQWLFSPRWMKGAFIFHLYSACVVLLSQVRFESKCISEQSLQYYCELAVLYIKMCTATLQLNTTVVFREMIMSQWVKNPENRESCIMFYCWYAGA